MKVQCLFLVCNQPVLTTIGMERLHKSMTTYVKSLSKRNEADDREKVLPVAFLGQTMLHHGEDFEPDSEFGNCLIGESSLTCNFS
jgi:hypothetical protein